MMKIVARESSGTRSLHFPEHSDPSDLERLVKLLEIAFGTRVMRRRDGLDQRYWDLELTGERLTLHFDTFAGLELYGVGSGPRALLAVLQTQLEALELAAPGGGASGSRVPAT
jgi:hypothetical protein